jgi:hypothetical protein
MFCPEHRAALEISHLLMARKWRYNKSEVVLVTARPYSYYKLPVPVVYMNSELHEVAYEGVKLLLNVVAQDGPASPQKLEIIPTMETIGFGM